jgi:hypothetical protein
MALCLNNLVVMAKSAMNEMAQVKPRDLTCHSDPFKRNAGWTFKLETA